VTDAPAQRLLRKLDDTLTSMSGILNTLLDINQIDAGVVQTEIEPFAVSNLLGKLVAEFDDLARSRSLKLRAVSSSLNILTDPAFLSRC